MNMSKLSTTTPVFAPSHSIATPENLSRIRDALSIEIVSAFGGDMYGNALILDAVRGGVDLGLLQAACIANATLIAHNKPELGYLLKGKALDTRKGKGKTLSNAFSIAITTSAICMPELGESLSGWEKRAKNKVPVIKSVIVPNSGQVEPIAKPIEQIKTEMTAATIKPAPTTIVPFETAEIDHVSERLQVAPSTGAKSVDNVKELVALIDDTLADDELTALIFELQKLRVDRNLKKAA
jgi:hypothetical protein